MASSALALLLPRGVPALRAASASLPRRCALGILAAVEPLSPPAAASAGEGAPASSSGGPKATPPLKPLHGTPWNLHPDYRRWKDAEEEILRDIEPTRMLTKHILHSDRYFDGERLSAKDEKEVIGKLLRYHPRSEDKIGCGLDYIMVDRHPQFKHSRCLFVVRTDGGWIDFSYQKCLRAYIRDKYPLHAERFIGEHLKRN
ncbi:protein DCL homolog, chloroplastic-like [Zingiber officinale]|uniref:protein DCL homolog, chloroplastic-like n=1 Tax=Zingiber officinale TaxID=94328 RepID=UPI001C4AB39C|nr:protein DCL homolog, chloroplastic-like [Zingiber officinale]